MSRRTVKTSLAPGSQVVTRYLDEAGRDAVPGGARIPRRRVRLHHLHRQLRSTSGSGGERGRRATSWSSRRFFPEIGTSRAGSTRRCGRPSWPRRRWWWPMRLAGTVDIDLNNEPIGDDPNGEPVFLADIWPTEQEVQDAIASSVNPQMFREEYATVFAGDDRWQNLPIPEGDLYEWNAECTYVQEAAILRRISGRSRHRSRTSPGPACSPCWRLGDDRPHFAGRIDREDQPGRSVPRQLRCRQQRTSIPTVRVAATMR